MKTVYKIKICGFLVEWKWYFYPAAIASLDLKQQSRTLEMVEQSGWEKRSRKFQKKMKKVCVPECKQ